MKIKKNKLPAPGVGLEAIIDDYLSEKMEMGQMSMQRATLFRANLVGLVSPDVIGFTRFLQARGIAEPSARDLIRSAVGAYYEYVLQHQGVLQTFEAMRALKNFWIWCKKNGLTREERMPPDLQQIKIAHPWRVQVSISE
jgi:hypothetical protein